MGVYVQDRTAMVGGREALQASLRDIEDELDGLEERGRRHGDAGVAAEVEAAIEATLAKPVVIGERVRGTVGSISARCTRGDNRTAEQCHRVAELRSQLAAAAEKGRREARIAELREQARVLRERGAGDAAEPVAELFAWMSRGVLSVRDVGFGFPVAFALLIEFVSTFGPIGIATYAAATRSQHGAAVASPATPAVLSAEIARIEDQGNGSVVDFVAEETMPAGETTATGSEELHRSYVRWCGGKAKRPLAQEAFTAEFDRLRELPALRGKIRKFGSRYFGITLTQRMQGIASNG
jgi:hypothetical protein